MAGGGEVMITDTDLKEKVVKLMSMAGTEGDAYCEWTVNQIVHGLREAVVGATPDKVTVAVETLVDEGIVKKNERDDKGKPQFVLTKKMPPPEPLQQSPVAVPLNLEALTEEVVPEGDPQARFQAQQQLQSLVARVENLEEVMKVLNDAVGGMKEDLGTLSKEVQAQSPKFLISDVRQELGRRIGACEIQVEGLDQRVGNITTLMEKAVENTVENLTEAIDNGVGIEVIETALREDQLKTLALHWKKMADSYADDSKKSRGEAAVDEGSARALRMCADDLEKVLSGEKVFVITG
jgi:hypothetical protein